MENIIFIKVPFISAVNTFNLSDNFSYSVEFTGFYQQIPSANDNFDTYNTGGSFLTQLFFSGSGNWNGSGYTLSNNYYFYDTFDNYQTGLISGYGASGSIIGIMTQETGLSSGITVTGYSQFSPLFTGYTIWSGYL